MDKQNYYKKYFKYKSKYLKLKNMFGGNCNIEHVDIRKIVLEDSMKKTILNMKEYKNADESEEDFITRINLYEYSSGGNPLKFDLKFETYNTFDKSFTMDELIRCFSLNEQPEDGCDVIRYNNENKPRDIEPVDLLYNIDEETYTIQNGRHRIVAHIIKNVPTIYACVLTNNKKTKHA